MSDDAGLGYRFEDTRWGTVSAKFQLAIPEPDQVSNVNVVPFIDNWVLIVRLEDDSYEVPGGTREANEGWLDTARRELLEEVGAHLRTFTPFGAWRCYSSTEKPYKPHLPHPEFYRVVAYGDVELIAQPTSPPDGEQIAAVELVPVEAAAAKFAASGRPDLADLYRLAARIRQEQA